MDNGRLCPLCGGRHSKQAVLLGLCTAAVSGEQACALRTTSGPSGTPPQPVAAASGGAAWSCIQCGSMSRSHYKRTHPQAVCRAKPNAESEHSGADTVSQTASAAHAAVLSAADEDEQIDIDLGGGGYDADDAGSEWNIPAAAAAAAPESDSIPPRSVFSESHKQSGPN